ncbi:MAG TPA: bifunctional UDP-N-acetylglucosamine diphosphorylase/glucosamine-1-phosphate N-acetyltransferase GlmU [Burkholderiales bacterium]|nr:bifunctional UDP-N-acetylglucosamine diphosphorylase/glucosamine-1-phosphate N-acetyltransferase GlmU [Burkholderiales bacterium]
MPDLDVVILAAGKGTRMHSDTPKVLHTLAGRPLLAHVIATARDLNPARIVVVYGHGGEQVRERCAAPGVDFVLQAPQLGTGHAVQQALPVLEAENTLILYGDVPLVSAETLRRLCRPKVRLCLLTTELGDPAGYGRIVRARNGEVQRIVEEKDATAREKAIREINTGMLCTRAADLKRWLRAMHNRNAQREYYLTDIVGMAAAEKIAIDTAAPDTAWEVLGVNSKDQLARVERIYQWERAQALMRQGVSLADPARIDVRGELVCGRDVAIDINCVFEGRVALGDRVRIGANCVIRESEIGAGSEILPFSHLDQSATGADCRVGPYSRLRPGTQLAARVHAGNFVEIKASSVADGSKINHLSYVGDTSVGRNVNIGAGTITCNYDGANKHRTVIEDDVFVGSDSQLVAPVTIGRGTTIGAGSTITRDTPPGELTFSRAKQVTVTGWKRPTKKQG